MSFTFTELTLKLKLQAGPLRKVTIPAFYTFGHLHEVMVFLFEWDDDHLHRFELPLPEDDEDDDISPSDPLFLIMKEMKKNQFLWVSDQNSFLGPHGEMKERDESEVLLSAAFEKEHDAIKYLYDFGSSWHVQIWCVGVKQKTVRKSQFVPSVRVVGGRGPTIPEYGRGTGTAYNKKTLNETLEDMEEFVYYPWNRNDSVAEEDNAEDEEEDSVLGKRRQRADNGGISRKRRRI